MLRVNSKIHHMRTEKSLPSYSFHYAGNDCNLKYLLMFYYADDCFLVKELFVISTNLWCTLYFLSRHLSFLQDQVIYTVHISVWILIFHLPVIWPLIYCRKLNYTTNVSHLLVDFLFLLMSWLNPQLFKVMYWLHFQSICSNLQSTTFHLRITYFLTLWPQHFTEKTFWTFEHQLAQCYLKQINPKTNTFFK